MTRPYLVQRYCADPNPHRPHPWPKDVDEDARFWCTGVFNLPPVDNFEEFVTDYTYEPNVDYLDQIEWLDRQMRLAGYAPPTSPPRRVD